ncbi:MAG: hypothetical protein JWM36_511 [Hyphomicrobiales bacterium]|nr:hypothetical protein [Hyphomicrobiales bacterium]
MNAIVARKTLTAIAGAATLGLGIAATATPAAAWYPHHHHGYGWGAPVAAGVVGALALGAMASNTQPGYSEDCWMERRPVYSPGGRFLGNRRIRVCE